MLDRSNLPDDIILAVLNDHYGMRAIYLEFLPIGNETGVWVFRARVQDGQDLFLKLRLGKVFAPALEVPRFLHENGVPEALAPMAARGGALSIPLSDDFHLIVYPYVPGENGMENGLTPAQWVEFGRILHRIHTAQLPPALVSGVTHESYIPDPLWIEVNAAVTTKVDKGIFSDDIERATALLWREKKPEIEQVLARTVELGHMLQAKQLPEILCHADIHTANMLVNTKGGLHVVDWNQVMIAPKERDLMFIVESVADVGILNEQERMFFDGYGQTEIDWTALAFYRYNWAVQEIADYARRVFLLPEMGTESRRDAAQELPRLFEAGNVVQSAYLADRAIRA
jgi:spectinomycin phosphotransferase